MEFEAIRLDTKAELATFRSTLRGNVKTEQTEFGDDPEGSQRDVNNTTTWVEEAEQHECNTDLENAIWQMKRAQESL